MRGSGREDGLPGGARADPGRAAGRIDLHAGQRPQADRHPAVQLVQPAVPGTQHGEPLPALGGDGDGRCHLGGRLRRDHQVGRARDAEIEPGRLDGVPRVARGQDARHPGPA